MPLSRKIQERDADLSGQQSVKAWRYFFINAGANRVNAIKKDFI